MRARCFLVLLVGVMFECGTPMADDLVDHHDMRLGRFSEVDPTAGAFVCLVRQVGKDQRPVERVDREPFRRGFAEFQRCL